MFQKEKFWGAKYVVAMDPLDGSSNIACNVPVIQQSPI
jgi:fructose-1,6-bisphosphatase